MPTDLGTKYPLFREKGGAPLITVDKVGPETPHFRGPEWLQHNALEELWENGHCRSAAFYQRNSKEYQELQEEAEEEQQGKQGMTIPTGTDIKILDEKREVKEMLAFMVEKLPHGTSSWEDSGLETPTTKGSQDKKTKLPETPPSADKKQQNQDTKSEGKEVVRGTTDTGNDQEKKEAKKMGRTKLPYTLIFTILLALLIRQVNTNQADTKHTIKSLNCGGPRKFFDLTKVGKCEEAKFSSYLPAHQTRKHFLYKPSQIKLQSLSCTVRVKISRALCDKRKNINKILGSNQSISGFKGESDEFVIIAPTKCLAAQATGGIELSLGNDRLYLKKIKGGTTNFEFYLGGSRMELEEGKECTPATNRAYLNKTHQHELVGGSIIRAEIDFRMEEGEATYTTEDNTLLTSSGEKVTFDERFMEIEITPYFPTIVDHKSITLFIFEHDLRKEKLFQFGEAHALQYNPTNKTNPSLLRISLQDDKRGNITAVIQVDNMGNRMNQTRAHGRNCSRTQFAELIVCEALTLDKTSIPMSPINFKEFLLSRDAGGILSLQQNVDTSVSGILQSICKQMSDKMKMIAQDFNHLGIMIKPDDNRHDLKGTNAMHDRNS